MTIALLMLYIAIIFVRPMDWWQPVRGLHLVEPIALATLVASIPRLMKDHLILWRFPVSKFALLLLASVALSWLPSFSILQMVGAFADLGKIILLYFLVLLLARDNRNFRKLLWTVFVCIAALAVHGIMQVHLGEGFGGSRPLLRMMDDGSTVPQIVAFGFLQDPNDLCLAFICVLPLLYAEYRASQRFLTRWLALAMIPLVGYGAYLTNSRGGVVGIFGMVAGYALVRARGYRRWLIIAAGGLLVILVAPSRFSGGMEVDKGRLWLWGAGLNAVKTHPVFGIGYNNYQSIADNVAHNSYIHALTELGLVGYIPWFMLLGLTMALLYRSVVVKGLIGARHRYYLSGLFSAMTGYLVASCFLSRAYDPILYIFLALAFSHVLISCQESDCVPQVFGNLRRDGRYVLLLSFLIISFFWIVIRVGRAI